MSERNVLKGSRMGKLVPIPKMPSTIMWAFIKSECIEEKAHFHFPSLISINEIPFSKVS